MSMPTPASLSCVRYEDWRGKDLSPPTEIDALYGLLFASFYYLYLQVRGGSLGVAVWPG
jgi:hypothetical protein